MADPYEVNFEDYIDEPMRRGMADFYHQAAEAAVAGKIVTIKCGDQTMAVLGPIGILGPGVRIFDRETS